MHQVLEDETNAGGFIYAVLLRVGENLGFDDATARELSTHIQLHPVWVKGGRIHVVRMPQPQAITECHLLALLFDSDGAPRYLTLERSLSGTVLGEWNQEGNHLNCGPGSQA